MRVIAVAVAASAIATAATTAVAQRSIAAARAEREGKAHGGEARAAKARRRPVKHARCTAAKPRRERGAHAKHGSGAHANARRRATRRKRARCPAVRRRPKRTPAPAGTPGALWEALTPPFAPPPATTPPGAVAPAVGAGTGQQANCIDAPSACGYPDATNTGVPPGTAMTPYQGDVAVTTPGATVKDLYVNGSVVVEANDTTIEDDEIVVNGTQRGCSEPCGGAGIVVVPGVTGTKIAHDTIHGGAATGEDAAEFCIHSEAGDTTVTYVYSYQCALDAGSGGTFEDNYCLLSFEIPKDHYECIYYGGGGGPMTVRHNTLLNPHGQTATVFTKTDFGDLGEVRIEDNLLAGGGYVLYGGEGGPAGTVLGPTIVTGNRFSRTYYPDGGYYGVAVHFDARVTAWSGNLWDETLQPVEGP